MKWASVTAVVTAGAGVAAMVATLVSLAGPWAWWADLATHFRPQLMVALVVVAVGQWVLARKGVTRRQYRWMAAIWLLGALVNLWWVSPLLGVQGSRHERPGGITFIHANLGKDAGDTGRLAAWAKASDAMIISLQEVTSGKLERVTSALGEEYRLLVSAARGDTRGVALFVRGDIHAAASLVALIEDEDRPTVLGEFRIGERTVVFLGFHTTRPTSTGARRFQGRFSQSLVSWVKARRGEGKEVLLMGDFNMGSTSTLATLIRRDTGLLDARAGFGVKGTYPNWLPAPMRVGIDQAMHSPELYVARFQVGPDIGSDHLPLLIRVTSPR